MLRFKRPKIRTTPVIAVDVEINAEIEIPVEPRKVREYEEFARLLREAILATYEKIKGGA